MLSHLMSYLAALVGDKLASDVGSWSCHPFGASVELRELSVLGVRHRVLPNKELVWLQPRCCLLLSQSSENCRQPFSSPAVLPRTAAIDAKHKPISPVKREVKG